MNGYLSARCSATDLRLITAPPSATSRVLARLRSLRAPSSTLAEQVAQRDSSIDQAVQGAVSMACAGRDREPGQVARRTARRLPGANLPATQLRSCDRSNAAAYRQRRRARGRLLPCRVKATGGAVEPVEDDALDRRIESAHVRSARRMVGELRPGSTAAPLPSSIATSATAVTSRAARIACGGASRRALTRRSCA